ncbi:MAG: Wzz/FepE/Etk N-terminal domain-containing protein, partial [Crocinitomicaceae bacterium]|nr:Wzz/FepE/Etk N-terminal domain-containing protein [Crocinitomicaceae bacterium]
MSKQYTPPLFEKQNNEEINIKDLIARYLQNWQWMAMSVFICLIVAFCFLNFSTPQYKSTAKVLIKEDNSGGLSSNMEIFEDLGLSSGSVNLENEIELFKSLTLLKKVSDNLNLSVKVNIKDEIYQSTQQIPIAFGKEPISLKSSTNDSLLHHKEVDWSLTIEEGNTFLLTDEEDDVELG